MSGFEPKNTAFQVISFLLYWYLIDDATNSMDGYTIAQGDPRYNHQEQRPPTNWAPHLLSTTHTGQSFPTPVTPSGVPDHGQHYPFYPTQGSATGQQQPQNTNQPGNGGSGDHAHPHPMSRTTSSLSLNLSSLTVTSPTNLSPINPPQSSHGLSPVASLGPSNNHPYHHSHHNIASQFQYNVPETTLAPSQQQQQPQGAPVQVPGSSHGSGTSTPYDESTPQQFHDRRMAATPTTASRSSSASSMGLLRKRSFSSNGASTDTLVEVDEVYDDSMDTTTPGSTAYDDGMDMRYTPGPGTGTGNASPVDGSGSGGEDDNGGGTSGRVRSGEGGGLAMGLNMNVLGKPMATNNFVTKLYQ
ncbi:hypothetical protein CCMSSC00406_0000920 [Pleurotus cornucopiae]|uniref:Uncharacterized protein n=1 Tax=Pleurotus cornucopiae TaxID=5321 RepID=A0ACB7JBH5_PLECO|nr:hypothetical protein CCMSSC00406_0000920 [Pleurotus cornucopiae]